MEINELENGKKNTQNPVVYNELYLIDQGPASYTKIHITAKF